MTPTTAPTPPRAPDAPRRLVRTSDKKIAGVCSGVAHYLGIDPTIVRVLFLLSIFAGGVGLLAYVVGWIVMPKGDPPAPGHVDAADGWTVLAVVAVALGAAAVFGWPGLAHGSEAVFGLLLIAGGAALLLRRPDASGSPAAVGPYPPDPSPTGAPPGEEGRPAVPSATEPAPGDQVTEQPPPARGRGAVTAGTLSVLAIGAAGLVAAALADWIELSTASVLAAALVIVGAGLVLASVVGPAPWLFVVATLLTIALVVAATVEPWVDDGVGDRTYAPALVGEIQDRYALGVGDLEVDLSRADLGSGADVIEVAVGVGNAVVIVPPGVDVVLRSHVGVGEIVAPGNRTVNGIDERLDVLIESAGDTRLVLDLSVGIGRGEVRHGF